MFNNRFNSSKNDPLVEAVKQAQADGDMRRQAIAAVNEQFGVFSRNAVVREDLAAYDAAIEEAYKSMKEGITIEPTKPNAGTVSNRPGAERNPAIPPKNPPGSGIVPAQTGSGKTINPKDDREIAVESKKLAKKDYDKDGKIESPKDEVWGSRFRAAKMAGKMEEGSAVSGEDPGMEVAKKAGAAQQSQTPSSTPARTGNAAGSTISNARSAAGMNEAQLDELKKPTPKTAMKALQRASDSDDVMDYDYKRTNRLYKWKQKHLPGKSARNQKSTGKADLPNVSNTEFHKDGYPGHVTKGGKLTKKAAKDTKADIKGRLGKHTAPNLPEDYQLDELTGKGKLPQMKANYQDAKKIHSNEADWHAARADRAERRGESKKAEHHMDAGYGHEEKAERAGSKLKRANALMTRAKATADIKSSKAASKSARAEYKEEVMRESIVAKLFAKHMKEDQSFNAAHSRGKPVNEVVSVAQLNAFRNKVGNQNATLGQYMNAQKGLTARKGGANDPSVIQKRLGPDKPAYNPSASASAPSTTTTMKTSRAANQSDIAGQVAKGEFGSPQSMATSTTATRPARASGSDITDKATYDTKTTSPAPFQPGPSSVKLSPEPQKFSGSAEGPTPVAKPTAPAPEPKRKEAGSIPAAPMAESVQIGANKYRIV